MSDKPFHPTTALLSLCNWVLFTLVLFSCASPFWSWGYYADRVPVGGDIVAYSSIQVSSSPFVAGKMWALPTDDGVTGCEYCLSTFISNPVRWKEVDSENACYNGTNIFEEWSEVYGYCDDSGNFNAPSQPIQAGNLIIASTVFYFFAAFFGLFTLCSKSTPLAGCVCVMIFVAWILLVASFSLWSSWNWVQDARGQTVMPAWALPDVLYPVPVTQYLGPSFGTAVTAFIISILLTPLYVLEITQAGK